MIDLLKTEPVFFTGVILILGLLVGSFLNVVIYRLPKMMQRTWAIEMGDEAAAKSEPFNLIKPDSTCPNCGHLIRFWQNIPIISFLLLGGRCRQCRSVISLRYPLIELFTALISAWVAWHFGFTLETASLLIFCWCLISLTFIDIDHQLLPDSITLSLLWLGLLLNVNGLFAPLPDAVIGAATGYLSLWGVYWLFKLITGKEGMGYGDFKLFAAFGAWFGWLALPIIILLSSLVGALVGISMIMLLGRDKQLPIPFGPYLCAAALVYVFWGDALLAWYLGGFA